METVINTVQNEGPTAGSVAYAMSPTPPTSDPAPPGVPQPWRRTRGGPGLAPLGVASMAAMLFVVLAAFGGAQRGWSAAMALAVLAAGGLASWHAHRGRATGDGAVLAAGSGAPPTPSPSEAHTYALALELAPNPVLLVSGEDMDDVAGRRVLFANAEARELLRIGREGALLVTALRHPAVLEAIDEALFGRLPRVLNYETGGGQDRFWRVWTNPLPANERHARLALVIMRDETDMRLNERMRADFLANASHELRTPLASLTGFIETLRGHARDDVAARDRFLLIMSRQAERMARLIDDLMSLSRIELNEHIRPAGACDLALAIGDVVDALAPQINAKAVRLALDLPRTGLAEIVGDRDQIVQVVQNLLDNAVKYAPPDGTVTIGVTHNLTLEAASGSRPGDLRQGAPNGGRMPLLTPVRQGAERYALIRVEDGGPGMAREHLPRLTERFYRVEGQRSGARMGTGLGLAIVKHIVNRHRGGFFVESAPEHGAAFGVYLPMTPRSSRLAQDGADAAAETPPADGPTPLSASSRAA